ncbi:alpha-2-macroglobulin-like protein 1 [Carassius auratus]|uniref:Alpha-2-macroglobulin-like protein 1 n=1 Tax=Carassius auratus TaxID=7957 RepID=A0A6P6NEG2_CARAU|nr:alpha-2-macroglobulin-like protein 1 [Carassius auratus]
MTGYVVASLLEMASLSRDPVITNGSVLLEACCWKLETLTRLALLAYTFSLAGGNQHSRSAFNCLEEHLPFLKATSSTGLRRSSGDTLAVEISSYVLLAVLSVQPLTTTDLSYANRIVNWLVPQQTPYGGFSLHPAWRASSAVTLQSSVAGEVYNFDVNRDNRLLYQEKRLKNIPGRYSVQAKGSTCVSVQVACFYNVPTPIRVSSTLSVEVKVARDCRVRGSDLLLNITVTYNGAKPTTNMVIVDIKLLSGFTADTITGSYLGSPPDSFAPLVQRVDAGDDHVLVYLKGVAKGVPMTYRLQLKQSLAVQDLKPAVVEVYDYYKPSDSFETTYVPPCL